MWYEHSPICYVWMDRSEETPGPILRRSSVPHVWKELNCARSYSYLLCAFVLCISYCFSATFLSLLWKAFKHLSFPYFNSASWLAPDAHTEIMLNLKCISSQFLAISQLAVTQLLAVSKMVQEQAKTNKPTGGKICNVKLKIAEKNSQCGEGLVLSWRDIMDKTGIMCYTLTQM